MKKIEKLNKFLQIRLRVICWFSNKLFDIHDYPISCGGHGKPWHMFTYECHNCKKKFII